MTDIKLTKWIKQPVDRSRNNCITQGENIGVNFHCMIRIQEENDNSFSFSGLSDPWFIARMSKDDAILTLKEAIAWIESSHEN